MHSIISNFYYFAMVVMVIITIVVATVVIAIDIVFASQFSSQASEIVRNAAKQQDHLGMSDDVGVSMWTGPKC